MAVPTENKTVQARILAYAGEIGWRYVSRGDAKARRGVTDGGFSNPPLNNGGQECPSTVEEKP